MTADRVAAAAANNAAWCDAICRIHGMPGLFRDDLWLNSNSVPQFYPNAITLAGRERSSDQIRGIAELAAAGIADALAVKDSYGVLDLAPLGFEVLFEATWIFRPASGGDRSPKSAPWSRMANEAELVAWEGAWRSSAGDERDGSLPSLFRASLLADPDIAFLACVRDGAIVGGAVANRAAGVAGLSNVFALPDDTEAIWQMALAGCGDAFPGLPIVGYESASDLPLLRGLGFELLIPLNVWVTAEPR